MKKTLLAIAVVASLLAATAFAKTGTKGHSALVISKSKIPQKYPVGLPALTPPSYCSPSCLFYGGDNNPDAPNDNGFANENTLLVSDTTVWGAFTVPAGQTWTVDGAFINTLADGYDGLDPSTSPWAIASGVSEGSGGSTVASGTSTTSGTSFIPTGRSPFGLTEYTLKVKISPAVTLSAGSYWLNITPQCTDSGNSSCSIAQYYFSSTNGLNRYGALEPADEGFFNSLYFGFDYANDCEVSTTGCAALSFGIIGTGTTD
ncbi:MAG: hypothetical protein ABR874_13275 [Candidatus Sulfotelmatobacter sp.]